VTPLLHAILDIFSGVTTVFRRIRARIAKHVGEQRKAKEALSLKFNLMVLVIADSKTGRRGARATQRGPEQNRGNEKTGISPKCN
jgi:hypothetical protein